MDKKPDYKWKPNKYDTAIGLFWAVSLFTSALVATNLCFSGVNPIQAILNCAFAFLIAGLLMQAIVTLCKKET